MKKYLLFFILSIQNFTLFTCAPSNQAGPLSQAIRNDLRVLKIDQIKLEQAVTSLPSFDDKEQENEAKLSPQKEQRVYFLTLLDINTGLTLEQVQYHYPEMKSHDLKMLGFSSQRL